MTKIWSKQQQRPQLREEKVRNCFVISSSRQHKDKKKSEKASKINVLCRVKVIGVLKRNFMQISCKGKGKKFKSIKICDFMMKLCKH